MGNIKFEHGIPINMVFQGAAEKNQKLSVLLTL